MSCSNSHCSISVSNYSSALSITQVKYSNCDGSRCFPDSRYSDESTTCTRTISSLCTCCACFCMYSYYTSLFCLHTSCSFRSFSLNSCKSFSVSSILGSSLCLCLLPLRLYKHSCFLHKLVYSELTSLIFLDAIDSLPLVLITQWYVLVCCCCFF